MPDGALSARSPKIFLTVPVKRQSANPCVCHSTGHSTTPLSLNENSMSRCQGSSDWDSDADAYKIIVRANEIVLPIFIATPLKEQWGNQCKSTIGCLHPNGCDTHRPDIVPAT